MSLRFMGCCGGERSYVDLWGSFEGCCISVLGFADVSGVLRRFGGWCGGEAVLWSCDVGEWGGRGKMLD